MTANATMLREFLDALAIDAGGSGRQRQRRRHRADLRGHLPERVRTPHPHRLRRPRQLAAGGVQAVPGDGGRWRSARGRSAAMLADKNVFRSPQAFGPAYEHPERRERRDHRRPTSRRWSGPPQRTRDLAALPRGLRQRPHVAVEAGLKALTAPTLIVWGTDDIYFDVRMVAAGWPRPSRARRGGSSSRGRGSSSPKSVGRSSIACCAPIGRPHQAERSTTSPPRRGDVAGWIALLRG